MTRDDFANVVAGRARHSRNRRTSRHDLRRRRYLRQGMRRPGARSGGKMTGKPRRQRQRRIPSRCWHVASTGNIPARLRRSRRCENRVSAPAKASGMVSRKTRSGESIRDALRKPDIAREQDHQRGMSGLRRASRMLSLKTVFPESIQNGLRKTGTANAGPYMRRSEACRRLERWADRQVARARTEFEPQGMIMPIAADSANG